MDASVLAALPWDVQKELIETLPRSRHDSSAAPQQPAAHGQQQLAAAQPVVQQAQAEALNEGEEQLQQQQQQQQQQLGPGEESSDEEAGWEPDSQPELAAATAPPHAIGPAPHLQPGSSSAATPAAAARASGGPGGSGGSRLGTPIQALPALSQVDPAVLDALPLGLKRELEMAYGAWAAGALDVWWAGVGKGQGGSNAPVHPVKQMSFPSQLTRLV